MWTWKYCDHKMDCQVSSSGSESKYLFGPGPRGHLLTLVLAEEKDNVIKRINYQMVKMMKSARPWWIVTAQYKIAGARNKLVNEPIFVKFAKRIEITINYLS